MTPLLAPLLAGGILLAQPSRSATPPTPAQAPAVDAATVPPASGEYRAELSNSDATLTYLVSPTDLVVAQRIRLELTVTAPAGWSVSWPAVGERLGRATVVDTSDRRDGLKQTRIIVLEPYLPGADTIPPLSVSASPRDPQSGAAPVTLTTEPVPLNIHALLADPKAEEMLDAELRPAHGADDAASGWTPGRIGVAAALGVVSVAAAIGVIAALKRRRAPVDPAFAALARIEAVAGAPAPTSAPHRNRALDELSHAVREFLQARGVENAVGAATPDLAPRIARVPALAPLAGRVGELLGSIDSARFDPRRQGALPGAIASELAGVLRPALTPPVTEARA